jgi:hypothetical protein
MAISSFPPSSFLISSQEYTGMLENVHTDNEGYDFFFFFASCERRSITREVGGSMVRKYRGRNYAFDFTEEQFLDGEHAGNVTRFINEGKGDKMNCEATS